MEDSTNIPSHLLSAWQSTTRHLGAWNSTMGLTLILSLLVLKTSQVFWSWEHRLVPCFHTTPLHMYTILPEATCYVLQHPTVIFYHMISTGWMMLCGAENNVLCQSPSRLRFVPWSGRILGGDRSSHSPPLSKGDKYVVYKNLAISIEQHLCSFKLCLEGTGRWLWVSKWSECEWMTWMHIYNQTPFTNTPAIIQLYSKQYTLENHVFL